MNALRLLALLAGLLGAFRACASAVPALLVVLVIDGLPQEQLVKYRDQYGPGGFRLLLDKGAWFGDAHQSHAITVTAPGHAAVLTGAYPYRHGIIANEWLDRQTLVPVYCTADAAHRYIGEVTGRLAGTSPANLRVGTLGDELRDSNGGRSRVIAISGKDRSAILLAGKRGTAYMVMAKSGRFASSTYYMKAHPEWHARYYAELIDTPFGDDATLDFARAAIEGEQLGRNPSAAPDLLGLSLSTHDSVNHRFGPESRESLEHLLRLDRALAGFFAWLDRRIGLANLAIVLTADHGFMNMPEHLAASGLPAARLDAHKMISDLNAHLQARFGGGPIARLSYPTIVLDPALDERRAEAAAAAARFLEGYEGIAAVYTRNQFESGVPGAAGGLGTLVQRSWHREISGDLYLVQKPYAMFGGNNATHGSPHAYDTHVPLIFFGPGWFRSGSYARRATVVDIAPTLARLLNIRPPAASEGRVLEEILRK